MKFTVNLGNVTFENLTEKDVLYVQSLCEDYARKAHILPRPVIRDGNGNLTSSYTCYDWIMKLQEEITETICCSSTQERAHELVDVITVCTSWLENLGYDERKRLELFSKVNDKNEKRGYHSSGGKPLNSESEMFYIPVERTVSLSVKDIDNIMMTALKSGA